MLSRDVVVLMVGGVVVLAPSFIAVSCGPDDPTRPPPEGPVILVSEPRIAMDGSGNAILVANWERWDEGEVERAIYVNSYAGTYDPALNTTVGAWADGEPGSTSRPGLANGDGRKLDLPNQATARNPAVAMNSSGHRIVVWEQLDPEDDYYRIFGTHEPTVSVPSIRRINIYRHEDLHGIPDFEDEVLGQDATHPQVALDNSGNAMVVWECGYSSRQLICANHYDAASRSWWPLAVAISSDGAVDPRIAMDDWGNAIALWRSASSSGPLIYSNRFENGSTRWDSSSEQLIGGGTAHQLASNSDHIFAVWQDDGEIRGDIYTSNSWQGSERIGFGSEPQIALNNAFGMGAGRALAVWQGTDEGFGVYSVYASTWIESGGWQTEELAEASDSYAYDPQVAMNNLNRARLVWWQNDSTSDASAFHVYANRVVVGSTMTWESDRRIDSDADATVFNPRVVMDNHGFAIAVWDDGESARTYGGSVHAHIWPNWEQPGQPVARFTYTPTSPRVNEQVTFDASESSDPDGTITTYEWDYEDDGTYDGTGVTSTHTYASAGEHTVRLRVTDDRGNTHEVNENIVVRSLNPAPVARFTYSPEQPRWSEQVDFDGGGSTGSNLTYAWDFDYSSAFAAQDTGSQVNRGLATFMGSPDPNDPHTIQYGGSEAARTCPPCAWEYEVVLRVTDDSPSPQIAQDHQRIVVYDVIPPTARFEWLPENPRAFDTLTFDASTSTTGDAAIATYGWEFYGREGTPDAGTVVYDPVFDFDFAYYVYNDAGDYQVVLTVTDENGARSSEVQTVSVGVRQEPVAAFTFLPTAPEAGQEITFDASGCIDYDGTINAYSWDFTYDGVSFNEDYTSSSPSATHTYNSSATYSVALVVTDDDGLTDQAVELVTVASSIHPPTAAFTVDPASPEVGELVTFNASGSTPGTNATQIVEFEWDFDDGSASATGVEVTHTFAAADTYSVQLTVTDDTPPSGLSDEETQPVTIGALDCNVVSDPAGAVPPLNPVTLTASAPGDPPGSYYSWYQDFGEGPVLIGAEQSLIHFPTSDTTLTVQISTSDGVYCTAEVDLVVLTSDFSFELWHQPIPAVDQQSWYYVRKLIEVEPGVWEHYILTCVWGDIYKIELAIYDDTGAQVATHVVEPGGGQFIACTLPTAYQSPNVSILYTIDSESVDPGGEYFHATATVYRTPGVGYAFRTVWVNSP